MKGQVSIVTKRKNHRWRGPPAILSAAQTKELIEIRARMAAIPKVADIASRWQVSRETVRKYLRGEFPKRVRAALDTEI